MVLQLLGLSHFTEPAEQPLASHYSTIKQNTLLISCTDVVNIAIYNILQYKGKKKDKFCEKFQSEVFQADFLKNLWAKEVNFPAKTAR